MFWAGFLGGSWRSLGVILGLLGPFLGPSRGHLGPCWTLLGSPWASLGPTWSDLGPAMGHIRLPLSPPWAFLVPCCTILRSLESFLGVLGTCLVPSWASLGSVGSPYWSKGLSSCPFCLIFPIAHVLAWRSHGAALELCRALQNYVDIIICVCVPAGADMLQVVLFIDVAYVVGGRVGVYSAFLPV